VDYYTFLSRFYIRPLLSFVSICDLFVCSNSCPLSFRLSLSFWLLFITAVVIVPGPGSSTH
jgi:hypothetical protein